MVKEQSTRPIEPAEAPIELIAQGASIVKLENSTQMQIAVQRPREESKILSESLKELDIYPSMAREAIYNKPVGKDEKGEMKYVEGLSIRAAESLANRWDNSSWGTTIVSEDEESATIAAIFLDYEKNTRHVKEQRVSKFYKTRQGQIIRYAPDRFDIVLGANSSKNLREVILRSLPAGLKKEYETKARGILKKEPLATQRQSIIERFSDLHVAIEQLEQWKGKLLKDWKKEDIIDALGLANAIRDGETSIESIFGSSDGKPKEEIPPSNLKPIESDIPSPEEEQKALKERGMTKFKDPESTPFEKYKADISQITTKEEVGKLFKEFVKDSHSKEILDQAAQLANDRQVELRKK